MNFVIERTKLKPGDIILSGDKSLTSIGVKASTFSRYSHAALYVGDTMIEATLRGVFSKNIQRLVAKNENDIAVYRSKQSLSEMEINMICSYARSKVLSLYALDEAITMRARAALKLDKTKKQFCSRLVAESYAYIGYNFINLRNPSYCSPRQLSLCKAFKRISGVIREALPEEVEFSKTPDPNEENYLRTFEWLDNVRKMAKSEVQGTDIQTISDVDEFLILNPEFDHRVAGFMEDSGYLEHYNADRKINPYRYDAYMFYYAMTNHNDPQKFLDFELEKEEGMYKRFTEMLEVYASRFKKYSLASFRLHLLLYINLLSEVHARLNAISHGVRLLGYYEASLEIAKLEDLVKTRLDNSELKSLTVT